MRRRTFIAAASATLAAAAITSTHAKETQMQEGPGYVDVNGVHMYYEVHGTGGTPLVLLHGAFSATGTSFAGMLPELSRNRTVVSFELQGHGHTADIDRPLSVPALADDVVKALGQLGIAQVDLFGYSLGAGVALRVAIDHPELVRRLVMASVGYNRAGFQPGFFDAMASLKPEMMAGSPWEQEYLASNPKPDFAGLFAKVSSFNASIPDVPEAEIKSIKVPSLLIAGDADIVTNAHAAAFHALLGGNIPVEPMGTARAWLLTVAGTSHAFIPGRADVIAPTVTRFLDADIKAAA